MRNRHAWSVLTAGVLLAAFDAPAASAGQAPVADQARAAAVLAEARTALGGEDKLAAVKRLQMNGTSRRANGNFTLEGDTEVFIELPDKFRRHEALTLGGGATAFERTQILNGNDVRNETSGDFGGRFGRGRLGGGPAGSSPDGGGADARQVADPAAQERVREFQRRNLQSEVVRLLLALLLDGQSPVAWIGTAQSPDGTADVLEMKTPDGTATRLFIDSTTRLPLMLTWTGPAGRGFAGRGGRRGGNPPGGADAAPPPDDRSPAAGASAGGDAGQGRRGRGAQGTPATLEMHLADYKAVNGVKFPHLITRGISGETNEEWVIKSYRINPNFKANTFTK